MGKLTGKTVAFIIAPENFRDEEYFQPKVILQSYGAVIRTAAKGDPKEVTGIKGGKAYPDISLESIDPKAYDALVLVGGIGVRQYFDDLTVQQIAAAFSEYPKVVGAICSAPGILAKAGLVKKKMLTSFAEERKLLENSGAKWIDTPVSVDGLLVTAQGPTESLAFGESISTLLQNQK